MKNTVSLLLFSCLLVFYTSCKNDSKKESKTTEAKTLTIWQTETDPNAQKVLDEVTEQLKKKYPSLNVEVESIPWSDLNAELQTALTKNKLPDITHLQPFMVYSFYAQNKLEPIDDVIEHLGRDNIYPSVRDLQKFDGNYYGIAYAIGTINYSYRKDIADQLNLEPPSNWNDYVEFVSKFKDEGKSRYGVSLPGGSAFFMQLLLSEFVGSNGGRLFDEQGNPTFTEKEVIETLDYFKKLSENAPPDWTSDEYKDQYINLINGTTPSAPLTFARFTRQIENDAKEESLKNPDVFVVFEPPVGPSGQKGISTIDCENWSIFSDSNVKEEAKEFLKLFYQKDNYLKYSLTVPVHLTPILRSVAESEEYLNNPDIKKWLPWHDLTVRLINEDRVKTLLVINDSDLKLPFFLELQGKNILSDMILDVTSGNKTPEQAAKDAEIRAIQVIKKYKN